MVDVMSPLQGLQVDLAAVGLVLGRVQANLRRTNGGRAAHGLGSRALEHVVIVPCGLDVQLLIAAAFNVVRAGGRCARHVPKRLD